jgi:hypothetical protein
VIGAGFQSLPRSSSIRAARGSPTGHRIRYEGEHRTRRRGEDLVIPAMIELGQQALAAVTSNVAKGEPLVRCQLLASEFYEALKRELQATSELGAVERAMVVAATNQCRHAATASISPGAMVGQLRSAMALLQSSGPIPAPQSHRPILRVIEGGLSRVG